jgi:excisionase family DNA binding protein
MALNVSVVTIDRLIARKQLRAFRVGRAVRILPAELAKFLEQHQE